MKPISARSLTGERCRAALAGGAPSSSRPAPCSTRRSSTPHSQALPGVRACGVYCLAPSHRPGYTSTAHIRQCLADTFCEVSTHGGAGVVRPSEPDRGVGSKTQPRPENERGGLAQSTARQRTARQTPARAARCPPPWPATPGGRPGGPPHLPRRSSAPPGSSSSWAGAWSTRLGVRLGRRRGPQGGRMGGGSVGSAALPQRGGASLSCVSCEYRD